MGRKARLTGQRKQRGKDNARSSRHAEHGFYANDLMLRLTEGARIDMGDYVLSDLNAVTSHADGVEFGHWLLDLPGRPVAANLQKLDIAQDEIEELVSEMDDWIRVGNHLHQESYIDRVMPFDGQMRTSHRISHDPVPSEWARRIARIVADLSSQLDVLVHALSLSASGLQELPEKESTALKFPVDQRTSPQSERSLMKLLPRLSSQARDVVLEAQPSRFPPEVDHRKSWLWMLHKLNNLDKHRGLNVTGLGYGFERGQQSVVFAEGEILLPAKSPLGDWQCEDGCVLDFSIVFGPEASDRFEHDDGRIEPLVPACRFLRNAYAEVATICAALLGAEGLLTEKGFVTR